MKKQIVLLIVLIHFLLGFYASAQLRKVEEVMIFSNKQRNPIEIEVVERGGKLTFTAINHSFYSYQVELFFREFYNLYPNMSKRKFIVRHGQNRLFELKPKDVNKGISYQYTYTSVFGGVSGKVDYEFPYLLPFKQGHHFKMDGYTLCKDDFKLYNRLFVSERDTICAMRKGIVVVEPRMKGDFDKISAKSSFEIMHKDGTVEVISPVSGGLKSLVSAGQKVYPGQPIGVCYSEGLTYSVYEFLGDGRIRQLIPLMFINDSTRVVNEQMEEGVVMHSHDIIIKEMRRREVRKYRKGKLFK